MLLSDAKTLATKLMNQHGLIEKGWSFQFDNARRRFGCCNYTFRRISLSKHLVDLNSEARVQNTILHEIAHALVGGGHGHDNVWKRKALEIGCDGNRCYTEKNTIIVKGSLEAVCPKCGHVHRKFKTPKKESSCGKCSNRFDRERLLVFKKV
jgi:predicted SprT family Zn-dependent metalloprotease